MIITENKCMCNGGCGHEFHEGEKIFRLITGSGERENVERV